jgi:hypothetical protein
LRGQHCAQKTGPDEAEAGSFGGSKVTAENEGCPEFIRSA